MSALSKFADYSESDMPVESPEDLGAELSFDPDLVQKTDAMFEGLRIVLAEHNMPVFMIENFYEQFVGHLKKNIDMYVPDSSNQDFVSMKVEAEKVWNEEVKYLLAYFMAKYLRNDTPKPPFSGGFFPSGKLRRWIKARLIAFNPRNTHLWYSFFQAKRACDPFSAELAISLFKDHFEALTKDDPYWMPEKAGIIDEILDNEDFKTVLQQVRKGVHHKLKTFSSRTFLNHSASNHACFENTRGCGGRASWLRFAAGMNADYWCPANERDSVYQSDLYDMADVLFCEKKKEYRHKVVERRCSPEWEDWESLGNLDLNFLFPSHSKEYLEWTDRYLSGDFGHLDHREIRKIQPRRDVEFHPTTSFSDRIRCEVRGVLEPLKCRMISKGEGLPYSIMKPLQIAMHSTLRQMDCFRLIGRPFCPTMLYDLVEGSSEGHMWLSIDYKAATDNLSWYFSRKIFLEIIRDLPLDLKALAVQVLGPHDLWYPVPNEPGEREFWGTQRNGQLMGSILSFPVLCLANLGCYLHTVKDRKQPLWRKLKSVLVNGDDMLFTGTLGDYERHGEISHAVGLELSVGKSYYHNIYANINSTSVHYDISKIKTDLVFFRERSHSHDDYGQEDTVDYREERRYYGPGTPSPREIGFLNVGLILNKHKVQGATDEDERKMREGKTRYEIEEEKYGKWYRGFRKDFPELVAHMNESELWNEYRSEQVLSGDLLLPDYKVHRLFARSHTHEDSRSGITENIGLALQGCYDERSRRNIMSFILNKWSDEIKRQTTYPHFDVTSGKLFLSTRNLFLPCQIGGMGISAPVGFRFKITKEQTYLAAKSFEDFKWSNRPILGFEGERFCPYKILPFQKPHPEYAIEQSRGIGGGKRIKKSFLRSLHSPVRVFEHPNVLF